MKFTAEEALIFTKRSVALIVFWPPPRNTSKVKLFLLDVYVWFSIICAQLVILSTLNGVYYYRDNFEIVMQTTCVIIVSIQVAAKVLAGRLQRSNYQTIIEEMESVIKEATPEEKVILNKYVNISAPLHITITVGLYAASINIILGPLFLPQELPTYAVYPFDIKPHPIFEFVYFQHAFIATLTAAGTSTDCFVAFLLWFAGARFEMLEMEMANIVDKNDLKRCIVKHAHILSYAEKVGDVVSVIVCVSVCFTTILMVFSGILFLLTDSEVVRTQFIMVDLVTIVQMFVSSYAAENLIQKSTHVGFAIYNLNWVDKSREIWHNVCILIQRSQKPVTVSISGVISAYSLGYYMSYLSTAFSYFTTLRAVLH